MNWKTKAKIARALSVLPYAEDLYASLQKLFGRLSADPFLRLETVARTVHYLRGRGRTLQNAVVMEVGTGHKPICPIGFYLLGAKLVYTYDLNRRVDLELLRGTQDILKRETPRVAALFKGLAEESELLQRLKRVVDLPLAQVEDLAEIGIIYKAPADAANTGLPDQSLDLHFSITTLEHIPGPVVAGILQEMKRVLKPDGMGFHGVDPSDHFQHTDARISRINFLRFSDTQWARWGNNSFSYCNRLRLSHYMEIFRAVGLHVEIVEPIVDTEALDLIRRGFELAPAFASLSEEDICTVEFKALLTNKAGYV